MTSSPFTIAYIRSQMGPRASMTEATVMFRKLMELGAATVEELTSSQWVQLAQEAVTEAEKLDAPKPKPTPPKRRWEYKFEFSIMTEQFLNTLGDEGWELSGVLRSQTLPSYIFKRELQ